MSSHRTALLSPQHSLFREAPSALALTLPSRSQPFASALASNSSSQLTTQCLTPGIPLSSGVLRP